MILTEQFPIINSCTYLNTASSGILSQSLLDWRRAHDLDFFENGSGFRIPQAIFLQELRENLARFFNANATHTFLVPNFSHGFNVFLEGLSGQQRFLLLDEDYPSVNYAVQSRGFVCDYLLADEHLEENLLEKIKTFKPTVFAFSIVQYVSGIKTDLTFIKKIKEQFPELLIVADGTQFCGTEYFDFQESGIDVLISSGYKWMLSGYGNGFVFLKDEVADQLYANTKDSSGPKEPFLQGRSFLSLCFEPGHLDTLSFGSVKQSLLFFEQLGHDFIENTIGQLKQQAKTAFAERDLLDSAVLLRKDHSSIFNISIKPAVYAALEEAKVICLARGKGLRVAFHFYNTKQDLDRLLEVIDKNS